jgi:hypothetical protein
MERALVLSEHREHAADCDARGTVYVSVMDPLLITLQESMRNENSHTDQI